MKRVVIFFLALVLLPQFCFSLRKPNPSKNERDQDNIRYLETFITAGNKINARYQIMNERGRDLQPKVDSKTATEEEIKEFEKLKKTVQLYRASRDVFYRDAVEAVSLAGLRS